MNDVQSEGSDPGSGRRTELAGERTELAGERTQLAWWRTGLAAFAVALGVGRVLPELDPSATSWPSVGLGIAFAIYGIAFFAYGARRQVEPAGDALVKEPPLRPLAIAGALLGVGTILVILFG